MGAKSALNSENKVIDKSEKSSFNINADNTDRLLGQSEFKDFAQQPVSPTITEYNIDDYASFEKAENVKLAGGFSVLEQDSAQSEKAKLDQNVQPVLSFREKIRLTQQIQAENQKRTKKTETASVLENCPTKKFPIAAENIIYQPIPNNFEDISADYTDDEERLAGGFREEQAFPHVDLFAEQNIDDEDVEPLDWHEFLQFCAEHEFPVEYIPLLQSLKVTLTKTHCFIKVSTGPQATIFSKLKNQLEKLLCDYLKRTVGICSTIVAYELTSDEEVREKAMNNPQIQLIMNEFGAEIYRCYDIKHSRKN